MKKEDFEKITESMQEKLGKENSALIGDEIGKLLTDNATVLKELDKKDKQIEKLKQDKENLIETNGNLLQQVSMSINEEFEEKVKGKEEKKIITYKNIFDEKGNFKR